MAATPTKLEIPATNTYNVQGTKEYIFNETGNIMLSSTDITGSTIPDEVRAIFAEVSVFFAAMTKRRLKRGAFVGVVDLRAAINRYAPIQSHSAGRPALTK